MLFFPVLGLFWLVRVGGCGCVCALLVDKPIVSRNRANNDTDNDGIHKDRGTDNGDDMMISTLIMITMVTVVVMMMV